MRPWSAFLFVSLLAPAVAKAESSPSQLAPGALAEIEVEPPSGRDWSEFPPPEDARGLLVAPDGPPRGMWILSHALLGVPRVGWQVVQAPVRGALYLFGRYRLDLAFYEIFFNEERTFGVFPTAFVETGFGLNVGARLVHRDLFGRGEGLSVRAGYGGRYEQLYEASVTSGRRFGTRTTVGLQVGYEVEPRERFYGIGNADESAPPPEPAMLDALSRDDIVQTRFREEAAQATAAGRHRLVGDLFTEVAGTVESRQFDEAEGGSGDPQLEEVFDTDTVIGFEDGAEDVYGQIALELDSARSPNPFISDAVQAGGVVLRGHLGYQAPLSGDDFDGFFRYGLDLQSFFNLFGGDRILRVRALAEEVSADLDEVPFIYLPQLGGKQLLRGYQSDRFRDRALTLVTAEYMWPLDTKLSAILFADAGRVQTSLANTELENLRLGYGIALQYHTLEAFGARAQLASSIDGGVFVHIAFNPILSERVRDLEP